MQRIGLLDLFQHLCQRDGTGIVFQEPSRRQNGRAAVAANARQARMNIFDFL